jgi:hypothetical protein
MKDEDEGAIQKPHGSFFLIESRRYFDTTGGCNLGFFSNKGARKQNPKSE